MLRWRGLVRIVVATALAMALSGVVMLAQDACTRTYRGDLVLEGSQRLVITEGVLCVKGSIMLHDNATLKITDATIRMTETEETLCSDTGHIRVHDGARLILENVRIEIPGSASPWALICTYNNAQAQLQAVHGAGGAEARIKAFHESTVQLADMSVHRLYVSGNTRVNTVGANITNDLMLVYRGRDRAELTDLRSGVHDSFELYRGTSTGFHITLEDTHVERWSVDVAEHAHVTVTGTTLAVVHLGLSQLPDVIEDLRPDHHVSWRLHTESDPTAGGNLILENTYVGFWCLVVNERRTPLTIRDSELGELYMRASTSDIRLEHTHVKTMQAHESRVAIEGSALTVSRAIGLGGSLVSILGEVEFQHTRSNVFWSNSSVGR